MSRISCCSAALLVMLAASANAQSTAAKPRYPVVCAQGVRTYTDRSQLPTKRDSLAMPPAPGQIRVTSPEEAEAAELEIRARAGSVGATSILAVDETANDGDGMRIRRSVSAFFIPADSAKAQDACKK